MHGRTGTGHPGPRPPKLHRMYGKNKTTPKRSIFLLHDSAHWPALATINTTIIDSPSRRINTPEFCLITSVVETGGPKSRSRNWVNLIINTIYPPHRDYNAVSVDFAGQDVTLDSATGFLGCGYIVPQFMSLLRRGHPPIAAQFTWAASSASSSTVLLSTVPYLLDVTYLVKVYPPSFVHA